MIKLLCLFFLITSFNLFSAEGILMLAGGGPEGDIGVKTDWSYPLYKKLIENGDTNGDKKIKVVVISLKKPDSNFMVDYLKSMGADTSENLVVSSRAAANNPKLMKKIKEADVVFFRGGNQGEAYQKWKGTLLHQEIKSLVNRNGAIGGTSSGTMALAQYSITGGKDFASLEVLNDAHSDLLNDEVEKDKSGIHNDFLNVADNLILDTHCGERARVGRMLAVMAKATEDYQNPSLVGLCLEEKTGVVISKGKATVFGTGLAHFMTETDSSKKDRRSGHSLSYTDVRLDALTEGWSYDLTQRQTILTSKPNSAKKLELLTGCGELSAPFKLAGKKSINLQFDDPENSSFLSIGHDAFSEEKLSTGDKRKGAIQTRAFTEMGKDPRKSIVLLDSEGVIQSVGTNIIQTKKAASLVLDCSHCSYTSESSFISTQDDGSNTLRSRGFVNMRVHVLGESAVYDLNDHRAMLTEKIISDDGKCQLLPATSTLNLEKSEREIVKKVGCQK